MLTYLETRIAELESDQSSAMERGAVESATQYAFAICELMDAKKEYKRFVDQVSMLNKATL